MVVSSGARRVPGDAHDVAMAHVPSPPVAADRPGECRVRRWRFSARHGRVLIIVFRRLMCRPTAMRAPGCDSRFDAVQAFTDDALTSCPQCSDGLAQTVQLPWGVVFRAALLPDRQPGLGRQGYQSRIVVAVSEARWSEKSSNGDSGAGSTSSNSGTSSSSTTAPAAASS